MKFMNIYDTDGNETRCTTYFVDNNQVVADLSIHCLICDCVEHVKSLHRDRLAAVYSSSEPTTWQ